MVVDEDNDDDDDINDDDDDINDDDDTNILVDDIANKERLLF